MKTKTQKQLIVVSIISFVMAIFLLSSSVFAWIALSKQVDSKDFIVDLTDVSSNLEFYLFNDGETFTGSGTHTISDECEAPGNLNCFQKITKSRTVPIFTSDVKLKPSDRISFAIKIGNLSSKSIDIKLSFDEVSSLGFILNENQIQRAFQYEITAIRYLNGVVESSDVKSGANISTDHFINDYSGKYLLLDELTLEKKDTLNSKVIVYFDLYFDELVLGKDEFGMSTGNSNAFMNQTLHIKKLLIELAG